MDSKQTASVHLFVFVGRFLVNSGLQTSKGTMCWNYYIMNKAFVCAAHTLQSGPALNYQVKGITELKPCFSTSTYSQARRICPFDCPLVLRTYRSSRRFEVEKNNKKSSSVGRGFHLFTRRRGPNRNANVGLRETFPLSRPIAANR